MDNTQNRLKTLSDPPIGWLNRDPDPALLVLKIYGRGQDFTSCLYFKIPLASLNRFLAGEIKGCPVFEEIEEGRP
jgi:hypothetical protein